MNKFNLLLLALTAILFASCSHESEVTPQGAMNYPVTFSLSGEVTTRATQTGNPSSMAALDREKKVTTLHAVVYKGGVFYKVFTPALSGSNYTFDMNQEGSFDVYLVANAASDVSAKFATNAATPAMLGNLLAAQTPGDGNAADNFLMTAQKFTVATQQGVPANGGTISLVRAAARIDVYNRVAKLAMTKITFKNRATQTRLVTPFTMDGIALSQDKTYETAQGLKPYELIGAIYGYENVTTGATELVLEGTYNGVTIAPKTIKLEGIPVKRNHLYSIIISEDPNAPGGGGDVPPGGDISNKLKVQIVVNDWNESTVLEFKGDNLMGGTPDFTISGTPFTAPLQNPTLAETNTNNATTLTFTLTNIAVEPILKVKEGEKLPAGVSFAKSGTLIINSEGKYEQAYTLTIPQINNDIPITIPLTIANALDPTKKREVIVRHTRPKMAIEYVAMYNIAPDGVSFAASNANNAGGYFNWDDAVAKFANITIDGKVYHLPSNTELEGVVPSSSNVYYGSTTNFDNKYVETITVKNVTKEYTADYRNKGNGICYALRYKDATDKTMLSAWRYEYADNPNSQGEKMLKVTARYLGGAFNGTVSDIENETYWSSNNGDDVTRIFPACGYNPSGSSGTLNNHGTSGYYWSSTKRTINYSHHLSFYNYLAYTSSGYLNTHGFTIRLFSAE